MSDINNYIIVGGTSGIGLATADYLRDIGNNVIVGSRHDRKEIAHDFIPVDVTSIKSVNAFFREINNRGESVDGLVYSVGKTTNRKPINEFDEDIWKQIVEVNVTGFLRMLKVFYPFLKYCSSKVVVVNSIASKKYSELSGFEYTASKCALSGIVRQLAIEWSGKGIILTQYSQV